VISEKKRAAVLALPAPQRYSHFIKVVADQNCIWALYQGGWALMGTGDDIEVFPVWPAQEYAALCVTGDGTAICQRQSPWSPSCRIFSLR
jgi:hypothetical protein